MHTQPINKPRTPCTQQGLSLLELIIIVVIVAIVSGMAMPSMDRTLRRSNGWALTHQLLTVVNFARTEAIMRSTRVTLCGSSNNARCDGNWQENILVFADPNGNGQLDVNEQLLLTRNGLHSEGTLKWRAFGNRPYLQFQANGRTPFQNGNFTYCPNDGDERYAIHWVLNGSGRLRIAGDRNQDGIPENAKGKNVQCP